MSKGFSAVQCTYSILFLDVLVSMMIITILCHVTNDEQLPLVMRMVDGGGKTRRSGRSLLTMTLGGFILT